jgi:hypothetical protein
MALHVTAIAGGPDLLLLSDLDGYLPEEGDHPEDFDYPFDDFRSDFDEYGNGYVGYAAETWTKHVQEVKKALETWREVPHGAN